MGRLLGIDYGSKRIGLAISDPDDIIATPLDVVDAAGSPEPDAAALTALARDHEITEFVVGLPLHMDGSEGKQARITRALGRALEAASSLPVHYYDERLSTYAANSVLRAAEVDRRERGAHQDKVAASIILQAFIDSRRRGEMPASGEREDL